MEKLQELLEKYQEIEEKSGADMASSKSSVRTSVQARARYFLAKEIVQDIKKIVGDDSDLRKMRELDRIKEIADANTLYPHEAAQMPHYSIMTIRDFYGPGDEEKHKGGKYDRENIVYFRFNFEKLEALFEIWSREGKLLHTELWGPREFNYEEFTGMVGDGAEWVVRSSDTGEKVARFSYSPENRYTAHIGDELHHLDDEVEMMEIMEEHLGGIRTVCCHCMDGCAQCDGLGFRIEKIGEVSPDAV